MTVLSTFVAADVATNDGRTFAGTTPVIVTDDAGDLLNNFCLPSPNVTTAPFVFCGFGGSASDFPASVSGKIALIQRGPAAPATGVKFVDKILNAKNAGATGVILFDHTAEGLLTPALGNYSTPSSVPNFPPTVFISLADGNALKASPGATVSLGFGFETWALESGTSMSTPHAAAVAALVWAAAPTATANDVTNAIENTATDLGDAGFDNTYGHGLVNAFEAAKQLNPAAFGSGGTPEPPTPTGRAPGRRGGH